MRCNRCLFFPLLAGLIIWGETAWFAGCDKIASRPEGDRAAAVPNFSQEVTAVLEKKTAMLKNLAAQATILQAVRRANQPDQDLPMEEIRRLDDQWRQTEGLDPFSKSLITNECGAALLDFQEAHDEFPEIFVTDRRGLIVGTTNKTTDYYQADEDWWVETIDEGRGRCHRSPIEYDESAFSEAISLYVPVIDPETKQAIGAVKAVCDVTAIKMEL
jgi:hypothetical protein